jgi:hypothetical protein
VVTLTIRGIVGSRRIVKIVALDVGRCTPGSSIPASCFLVHPAD